MKLFFIIMAVIVAGSCSCSNGSNNVETGTVSLLRDTFRCTDGNYKFDDHANPLHYTGNNLCVDAFLNNAIRKSGVLTSDEVLAIVAQAVDTILF